MNYDFATLSTTHVSTTNKDLVDEDDNTNTNATSSTIDLDQASQELGIGTKTLKEFMKGNAKGQERVSSTGKYEQMYLSPRGTFTSFSDFPAQG